jgi:hypothetical protein
MAHSSIVGGSTAGRLLNCPASFSATRALPPSADVSSEYAEEGTAMHDVMTYLMSGASGPSDAMARTLVGMEFHDRTLTKDHLDSMILPALDAFWSLLEAYDIDINARNWPDETVAIERRVAFPGIPGAFGTCDVLLRVGDYLFLVDWKFGAGIPVKAIYHDEEGDLVNPQLLFYAGAAMSSAKALFKGAKVLVAAIIQPRATEPLTHTRVTRREIKWFREDLQTAVVEALDRNPRMAKGEHCRFAPCKVNCPLWTGPLLELTKLPGIELQTRAVAPEVTMYGHYLARAKALVDILAMFKKEVDEQLHAYLEAGGLVPGWRLKAKAKQRQWVDEDTVAAALQSRGFQPDEIWRQQLVTFASADATARRLGVKIPDDLRIAPETTETTVAATDDPAPVIDRRGAAEAFQTALKALGAPAK